MATEPPPLPRSVKPRKPGSKRLPIIAVARESVYVERLDRLFSRSCLPQLIASEPSSYVAVHNAPELLRQLTERFGSRDDWQFRASPVERLIFDRRGIKRETTYQTIIVAFFGFRGEHGKNRYHTPLDPLAFLKMTSYEMRSRPDESETQSLYLWAAGIREWAEAAGIKVRPTAGGITAQLLRDPRFYPKPRRKIPAATNAKAREQLPGNHYRLAIPENESVNATYLDQESAHHSAAAAITFPSSDSLVAKGFYVTGRDRTWLPKERAERFLETELGLFRLEVNISVPDKSRFLLPQLEGKRGFHRIYAYSNELDYLRSIPGVSIVGVSAAWSTSEAEPAGFGLAEYGKWALAETRQARETERGWKKPLLLTAYGILAAKPRPMTFGFHRAVAGNVVEYPAGAGILTVKERATTKERELPIANVIHRGMIEAQTRLESIRYANELLDYGFKVAAIYADAIFVVHDPKRQLPSPPPPWRVKDELTRLTFFTPTSWASRELARLPGIPREGAERVRRLETFAGRLARSDS